MGERFSSSACAYRFPAPVPLKEGNRGNRWAGGPKSPPARPLRHGFPKLPELMGTDGNPRPGERKASVGATLTRADSTPSVQRAGGPSVPQRGVDAFANQAHAHPTFWTPR